MMADDGFGRRLLVALADASPAFLPPPAPAADGFGRRLLVALADASPAFRPSVFDNEIDGDRASYGLSRIFIGRALHLLARIDVTGRENIPETGGAILASNHLSVLDSFFLPLVLRRPVTFAKSEWSIGTKPFERIAGAYLRASKQFSVDRAQARAAQETLEAALRLITDGGLVGIYPEGTPSPDGRLYRGRTGIGWLALHSGVPVIPVATVGTDKLLPPGRKIPRPGRICIRIGKPLLFNEYRHRPVSAKQRRAVTDQVIEAIQALSGQEYAPMYASVRNEQLARARDNSAS